MLRKTTIIISIFYLFLGCNQNVGNAQEKTKSKTTNLSCDETILEVTYDKFEKVIKEYKLLKTIEFKKNGNQIKVVPRIYTKDGFYIRVEFKTDKVIPKELGYDKLIFLFENDSTSELFANATYGIPFNASPVKEQHVDFWPMLFEPHSFKTVDVSDADNWKEEEKFLRRILKLKVKSIRVIKNKVNYDIDLVDWQQTYFMKIFQCVWGKME